MSTTFNSNKERFYFDSDVSDPLLLEKIRLRSEKEYDGDVSADKTALKYLERISACFDGYVYLVTASHNVGPISKVRQKKGVLWDEEVLRDLEIFCEEVEIRKGRTRFVSLVNLENFNYDTAEEIVLNYVFSFILLTKHDQGKLNSMVKGWVFKKENSVLAFDYDVVAKDLLKLTTTAVLRYFPADNGKDEALVVMGNRKFIEESVKKCVLSVD